MRFGRALVFQQADADAIPGPAPSGSFLQLRRSRSLLKYSAYPGPRAKSEEYALPAHRVEPAKGFSRLSPLRKEWAAACDPVSHWVSAATPPSAHSPPAPCTPAVSPSDTRATPGSTVPPSPLPPLPRLPHRPPVAGLPTPLPAPSPPPASLLHTPATPPQSRPTLSGIPGPSPAGPDAPDTPTPHLLSISPGLPSDTISLPPSG